MKIAVIGIGYVGLVQSVGLAELGNDVVGIDIDKEKIKKLKLGICPIYEPGLEEILKRNLKAGRLVFSNNFAENIFSAKVIFIAVGTPEGEDGRADLTYVKSAAEMIAKSLAKNNSKNQEIKVIVNKSTVPIGTGDVVAKIISQFYKGNFSIVSNPEFLREGQAVKDFFGPDRIVLGNGNDEAKKIMAELYAPLNAPILFTNLVTAELIKYASNSFLACEISYINALSRVAEKVGADITEVAEGMKLDKRIGKQAFLNAGLGYGGSCFPKDIKAMIKIGEDFKAPIEILEAAEKTNQDQRRFFYHKIEKAFENNLKNKKIAVWGLAFKPQTDDLREAPALDVIKLLLKAGAKVTAYDPVAEKNAKKFFPKIGYAKKSTEALKGADGLIVMTEWDEFKECDFIKMKKLMKTPLIVDGRNIWPATKPRGAGFRYFSVGR